MPAGACDAHVHIYDRRFPPVGDPSRVPAQATAADYQRLQARTGTERTVVVTPTVYGTDNRVTLDAIAQLGAARSRGVAVLHPDVSDATLAALDAGGVRGIRFTLFDPATAVTRFDMVEPLARRVAPLGWHLQLHWRGDQIAAHAALLQRLPCTLVFDHYARLPHPAGADHAAFGIVRALVDADRAWIKMSAPYLDGGPGAAGPTSAAVARAWLAAAPERLVWGSDWPHPTERTTPVDDAALLDRWAGWIGTPPLCRRILVDNPARLYGF